jgi:hypothetical protein
MCFGPPTILIWEEVRSGIFSVIRQIWWTISIIEFSIILGVFFFWLIRFEFPWEKLGFCKILTLSQGHSSQSSTHLFICELFGVNILINLFTENGCWGEYFGLQKAQVTGGWRKLHVKRSCTLVLISKYFWDYQIVGDEVRCACRMLVTEGKCT